MEENAGVYMYIQSMLHLIAPSTYLSKFPIKKIRKKIYFTTLSELLQQYMQLAQSSRVTCISNFVALKNHN